MESLWLQICDIQGRLFKLAWKAGYDSEDFMKQFMRSRVARDLDSEYNRMQWAGEEYLLEEFADECPQTRSPLHSAAEKSDSLRCRIRPEIPARQEHRLHPTADD